jgi:hypothetical protein
MEINDILSILDIEAGEDATPESITEAIKAKWVPRALAHEDKEVAGRVLGVTEVNVKRILKSVAEPLGLDKSDIDEKFKISKLGIEDENNPLLISAERIKARMAEMEKAKSGKGADSKEWETKLETAKKEATTFKEMLEKVNGEYEGYKSTVAEKERTFKINHAYDQALSSFNLSSEVDNIRKLGFNTHLQARYKFDLDDDGNVKVLDAQGNQVKNSKGTGFAGLKEVLEMELNEAKMLAKNNGAATPAKPTFRAPAAGSDKDLTPNMRKSQEHAERLRQARDAANA